MVTSFQSLIFAGVFFWSATAVAVQPPITSIAFAPDGKSVCTCSQAGVTVRSWPALNIKSTIRCSVANLHHIAFSADGKRLAVAGGAPADNGTVEIFSWPDGKLDTVLEWHSDSVMQVTWLDDTRLATCSLDHDIAIWELGKQQPVGKLKGHSRGVTAICFLPAQNTLVSAGIDQSLRAWDTGNGELIHSLNIHTLPVRDLAIRPNQDVPLPMIASASEDRSLRLWQPTIGRMVRFARLSSKPLDIAWTNRGDFVLASCEDGSVHVVDPETVAVTKTLPAIDGWAYSIAVHPADHSVLVGGSKGQMKRIVLSD